MRLKTDFFISPHKTDTHIDTHKASDWPSADWSVTFAPPASALGDSMDQLSQRSSSDRTQFMSRDDLDQEGSLDLEHDQYHYHDQDQNQSTDQELDPHEDDDQDEVHRGSDVFAPGRTLELKVRDQRAKPP